ncbi:MAG: radical SAM protein [uncultured bacterium]|nr:MAG: radical SAM protein [uncultured bacterium]
MKRYILRKEGDDGKFYKFDRDTGRAEFLIYPDLTTMEQDSDFHIPQLFPKRARAAPFCAWFKLTDKCNLQCPYCSVPASDLTMPTMKQINQILDNLVASGVFEVRFTGGEPAMHPKFCDAVKSALDKGLYVSINSNGLFSEQQLEKLSTLTVGMYIISLDGTKEVNDQMRPQNSYDKIIKTIYYLTNRAKPVRVNATMCKINQACLSEFVPILQGMNVAGLTLVPLRPAGPAKKNFETIALSRKEYGALIKEVTRLEALHRFPIGRSYDTMTDSSQIFNTPSHFTRRCVAGTEAICIKPNGDVHACILLGEQEYIVGNLFEEQLSRIWANDEKWGRFRDENCYSARCNQCTHFSKSCAGMCYVMAIHHDSPERDPYCQLQK